MASTAWALREACRPPCARKIARHTRALARHAGTLPTTPRRGIVLRKRWQGRDWRPASEEAESTCTSLASSPSRMIHRTPGSDAQLRRIHNDPCFSVLGLGGEAARMPILRALVHGAFNLLACHAMRWQIAASWHWRK